MLYLHKRQYLKYLEEIMFKKIGLTVLLILVSFSLSYAGNIENSKFLMDHGFKVTANDNQFIINKRGDDAHPLLLIEKLPSRYNISAAGKSKLLENLSKEDKSKNPEGINRQNAVYEETIKNQSQRAYVLVLDVNFDGLYDFMISPEYRYDDAAIKERGEFIDVDLINIVKKYADNLDLSKKFDVHCMYHCYSRLYSFMPMFEYAELYISKTANITGSINKFSSSLYNIHEDEFAISTIKLISKPDGNFTVILKDEKNNSNPREVHLQTNIKWN